MCYDLVRTLSPFRYLPLSLYRLGKGRVSLSFSDPRSGAWSRDSGVEEVGHPLQTSWARNMVPDVHSFMTPLGNRDRGNSTIASTNDGQHT